MQQFKNIALVYPCDDSTLQRAAELASDNGARLTLVQVLKSDSLGETLLQIGAKSVKLQEIIRHEHESNLKELCEGIASKGVQADWALLDGSVTQEIIRFVLKNQSDLVVITAEGNAGFAQQIFGSVSSQLIRKCPVPLLVVKPGESRPFKRIMAAIDPVVVSEDHEGLNESILKMANGLAERDGGELHIVHSWVLVGESLLLGRGGLTEAALAEVFDKESRRRLKLVSEAVGRTGVTKFVPHVAKGEPANVICQIIQRSHVDLLVMGTVCRTGIPGFLIGNTAESILDKVECSVLVIKPEKFVSPVTTA